MKYKDIYKVFDELYLANRNKEEEHYDKFCKYTHEGKNSTAEYHRNKTDTYYHRNEALMEALERIEELAEQAGEDVNV